VFRDRIVINVDDSEEAVERPAWRDWRLVEWNPEVNREILRLMADPTCRYCCEQMRDVGGVDGRVLLCPRCGYWGGRGTRFDMGPLNLRGVLGLVHLVDLDSLELTIGELVGYFREVPDALFELSPFKAERFVMDLLKEALDCEVRPIGGRKDGGVDGYIVAGEELKTIVQVKWHRDKRRAEGVRLVREIAGTLIARGVPNGMLVTTSERLSPAGKSEIEEIGRRELVGLGAIRLDVRTYEDVLDMLDLAWTNLGGDFETITPALCTEDSKMDVFG
jgi:hypothetical protein